MTAKFNAMIVTIDGPAGAGKSSAARFLAERLGFQFLDTGAMYRSVAWLALAEQVAWDDSARIAELVCDLDLQVTENQVLLNGQDITREIREPEVGQVIHHVADNQQVRKQLVQLQRRLVAGQNVVTEGRDQGSVAFPDADCKIYLTASPAERARRRSAQLRERGVTISWEEVLVQQNERDERDRQRPVGGLAKAADAVEVSTDNLSVDQVVDKLETLVRSRMSSGE
ncbi:MAG: (d)CMP kinase [Pirellulaceae bacterium]